VDLTKLSRYENKAEFVEEARKRAHDYDFKYHGCTQAVVQAFLDIFEEENPDLFMAASPFAAGMSMTGNNCGALIGGLMVLGVVFGRSNMNEGMKGIIAGIRPSRKLVKQFKGCFETFNCCDLTQTDLADPEKAKAYFSTGGLEKCAGIVGQSAAYAADILYCEYLNRKAER
jgi:C_GCAxxG_C_C family probable redox protein